MKASDLSPHRIIIALIISLIFTGTLCLKLPFATVGEVTLLEALFTSTSAMTATGLVVIKTGPSFTLFGELVILVLIQLGGLGIMIFSVLIYSAIGKKIGIEERLLVKQAINKVSLKGMVLLARDLLYFALTVEAIAVILLSFKWVPEMGWGEGIYSSIFHAVSAFNNAGFSLWPNSLSDYATSPIINGMITLLFVIGGIGFSVIFELARCREFKGLALHTKLMIIGTFVINALSILVIFLLEFNNPQTIGDMSLVEKWQTSYFQALTPRTAGFHTIPISQMEESSLFYMIILMFIGGGSASTAGGIKLTTAITVILAAFSFLKDREHVVVFGRSLRYHLIMRTLALTVMSAFAVMVTVFMLNLSEDASFLMILFESVSAFGTVGLSMGLTPGLTAIGKIVIIMTMLVGKLGPLTFAFAFAQPAPDRVKYPNEEILTG